MIQIWNNLAAQPILIALVFGLVAWLSSRIMPVLGKVLAVAMGAWVVLCGVSVLGGAPMTFAPLASFDIFGITLKVQFTMATLGNLVAIGVAAFTVLIAAYSFGHPERNRREGKFYAYLIWVLAGACIVAWASNFFVLLIGWEIITLMLLLMLNLARKNNSPEDTQPRRKTGFARALIVMVLADACLVVAMVLMFSLSTRPGQPLHNLALAAPGRLAVEQFGSTGYAIYALLLVAALARIGAVPLHTWIPAAAGAPAPVLACLPGMLNKLVGVYLIARVSLDIFAPDTTMQIIMMVVGALTIIVAAFRALAQHNLKRLLIFDDITQIGYIVLGIGTGTALGVIGGLFHTANSAIYGTMLFLMSGIVTKASGSDDIENMGGLARRLPITFACGIIAAAAISGIPPFNGFVSKWLIYQAALGMRSGMGVAMLVVAVFGSALTLASFVKVIYSAFLSRPPVDVPQSALDVKENFWTVTPMILLAACCVMFGLYPQPCIDKITPAIAETNLDVTGALAGTDRAMTTATGGLWNPSVAMGLILIGIAGGLILSGILAIGKVRVVRPFLSGEMGTGPDGDNDDRFRIRGTGFYETLRRLPIIRTLMKR
jgi:formate hydrogenlyase subunit 3/multisubunit Na+/H+ antiporter MnhD subunit